ncbi:hypothetical protein BKA61DRAFT_596143 [Leptodontidium sp. MPI-SDFR-AT-0119]|nr:hypothetical protein BKA61DRAFT_596143 [Leptodontidium sp. MPI-SDFR-AT-0119]
MCFNFFPAIVIFIIIITIIFFFFFFLFGFFIKFFVGIVSIIVGVFSSLYLILFIIDVFGRPIFHFPRIRLPGITIRRSHLLQSRKIFHHPHEPSR